MNSIFHRAIILIMVLIVVDIAVFIGYYGYSYYHLPLEERYFHNLYSVLKPSGFWGHGFGIFGAIFILTGLFTYMGRKRIKFFSRFGLLKHWLEFHIFLCTLGPVLILYHTSFKFGGIVGICFWSMVLVVLSGIIGRFIYIRIPHTIEGRELSLQEVQEMRDNLARELEEKYSISESLVFSSLRNLKKELKSRGLTNMEYKRVRNLIRSEILLTKRIGHLENMQKVFRYWHVIHLPFALIMLITLVIHVTVALVFGYRWIF